MDDVLGNDAQKVTFGVSDRGSRARPNSWYTRTVLDHHRRALERAVERLGADPEVRVVLLGGSVAKETERPESDVDLIVVVSDESYADRLAGSAASFLWTDVADWAGGYVEGRYVSRGFVREAAERGSEPTRWSFLGARPVWGADSEIVAAVSRIPVYPEADRARRIDAFLAQLGLAKGYFWSEGTRRGDPYLRAWAALNVVRFAGRVVLAHDRVLFPNQKRLMETVALAPSKPADFERLAERTLSGDETARDALWQAAIDLVGTRDWGLLNSRFEQDSEMSWFTRSHEVAEW